MTLHLYGSTAGQVLSMSDSRTTEIRDGVRRIAADNAVKSFFVPLFPPEEESADLSAVVLVQGRATFTKEGKQVTAHDLLRGSLVGAELREFTVHQLGELLWESLKERWWDCESCRDERDEVLSEDARVIAEWGDHSPYFNPEGEYACGRHGFVLIVLGFNAGDTSEPMVYRREWLSSDRIESGTIQRGQFFASVDADLDQKTILPDLNAPDGPVVSSEDSTLVDWLRGRFKEVVAVLDKQREDAEKGPVRGIGGAGRTLVIASTGLQQTFDGWPIVEGV